MTDWLLPKEPPLRSDVIQGNVLGGFLTDEQVLVGLRIDGNGSAARAWLAALASDIASVDEVTAFKADAKRRNEVPQPDDPWLNVAISHHGLGQVGAPRAFADESFCDGLFDRADELGDPPGSEWFVGGPEKPLDVLLILAGRPEPSLKRAAALIESAGAAGLAKVYFELGSTIPDRGIEHFGFRDGISQPGVLGVLTDGSPLTARPEPDGGTDIPLAKPGQPLVWPGQFVFGYEGQNIAAPRMPGIPPFAARDAATRDFACDGSLLVFRRLRQNVGAFRRFLDDATRDLRRRGFPDLDAERLGAMLVGRWKSGAPLFTSPGGDDSDLGGDPQRNDDFDFFGDPSGLRCPVAAHIRKVNPRKGSSDVRSGALERRILRRGIPYGRFVPLGQEPDDSDRGLLFLCYQTSIEEQFRFLVETWINGDSAPANIDGGYDVLVGQESAGDRARWIALPRPSGDGTERLPVTQQWVTATGGEYLFAPSIAALRSLSSPR